MIILGIPSAFGIFLVISGWLIMFVLLFCFSLEWWSFEILILMSGLLPNPELQTSVLSIWYETTTVLHWIISTYLTSPSVPKFLS